MNSNTINYYKAAASQISLYPELNLVIFNTIVDIFLARGRLLALEFLISTGF